MTNPVMHPALAREVTDAHAMLALVEQIGQLVREHRQACGLSQREVAHAHGWSRGLVARLENDASSVPLGQVIQALTPTTRRLWLGPPGGPGAGGSDEPGPDDPVGGAALPMPAGLGAWQRAELRARVRREDAPRGGLRLVAPGTPGPPGPPAHDTAWARDAGAPHGEGAPRGAGSADGLAVVHGDCSDRRPSRPLAAVVPLWAARRAG